MNGAHKRRNKKPRDVAPKTTTGNTAGPEDTTGNTAGSEDTTENTAEPEDTTENTAEPEDTTQNTAGPEDTTENTAEPEGTAEPEKEITPQAPEKNLKYYFNRFRYYHYVIAEKVDTAIGVLCLMIIKVYFFLTGHEQFALESDGSGKTMKMGMIGDDD